MSTLCFLHGFLGCKEDFNPLIEELQEFHCHAINYTGLSLEEIKIRLQKLKPSPDYFIGYSMGGRILMKLQLPNSILLSAHPGLATEAERKERWKVDLKWIELLKTRPLAEFLEIWYSQELFHSLKANHPVFNELLERRKKENPLQLTKTLETFSLAHDCTSLFPGPLFVYGAKDLKFQNLYLKLPSFVKVKKIEAAGHAVHLENPKACSALIKGTIYEQLQSHSF